jgi:hypothetical protein
MKIMMKKSTPGAVDGGLRVVQYEKGKVYETANMEGVGEIFLGIGVAEVYEVPVEFKRKAIQHAPTNKMEPEPENKAGKPPINKKKTAEFFQDMKAGQIRSWAAANSIDLLDVPGNTGVKRLIEIVLERQ